MCPARLVAAIVMEKGKALLGFYSGRMGAVCERMIPETTDMSWLKRGDSVFIKIACNSPQPHPAVTDPNAVEALVRFLYDCGAGIIYVGDQGGVEHVRLRRDGSRKDSTQSLMNLNGLIGAVARSKAALHCFDDRGWDDGYFKPELDFSNNWDGHLWLPKILREVDHIVYLPRLGAHVIAGYTCGIKNAVGFLRDDSRMFLHQRGATFHEKIAEINHVKEIHERLRFCLTMGRSAMVNYGPDYGEEYDFDGFMALCSNNLVDHDSAASALLPWLNSQRKSIYDIYNPVRQADLWNRVVTYMHWGKDAMADYEPIAPHASEDDPCISRLAMLQGYRPEKIAIHRQGDRFPDGLISHLSQAGDGMFII